MYPPLSADTFLVAQFVPVPLCVLCMGAFARVQVVCLQVIGFAGIIEHTQFQHVCNTTTHSDCSASDMLGFFVVV